MDSTVHSLQFMDQFKQGATEACMDEPAKQRMERSAKLRLIFGVRFAEDKCILGQLLDEGACFHSLILL